jgi:AcrR family transcriptional regulator
MAMPKLADIKVERNQEKIEQAALRLFIQRGFYGTSVRDIARAAGVSLGNIYNYYPTKQDLFARMVRRYEKRMALLLREVLKPVGGSLDPPALRRLAEGVRKIVYSEPDYWRLMYLDVIEFGNRHFAHNFRDLSRNLQAVIGTPVRLGDNGRRGRRVDAGLAFTAIYLQFFTYFLVEKLFGGKQHLGFPEQEAIGQLIEIFSRGVHSSQENGSPRRALKVRRSRP